MSPDPGSIPEKTPAAETRFVADRMLGTLTRYLRFMGYDTISANGFLVGNAKEDTFLLDLARQQDRILLTGDHELAQRGGLRAVLIRSDDVMVQVRQLVDLGFVTQRLRMIRCSLCNTVLREATEPEIAGADYAPHDRGTLLFCWCDHCHKLYWNGSHGKRLSTRIGNLPDGDPDIKETG